ncbi:TetR family transcriptional regulator [Novosphingobium sp. PC22D]|uniref:TetR/AcrR family transcriptional regulator n=1 Tax=Novosphingobium sp. PC22D TaxID=1962403 RepID=UPI000BEF543C|nr:TetR/AcrR family transcriptional regulator [Novosphingobium sp. PC22D]PEQ12903.1 TetR family transcriptional regulator [Novosphingobium sp. PC22D]
MPEHAYHHGDLASALLKAAEEELALHGIEAFSLRAVAKRAGVSHGAPAHHFKDAKGLLTTLAARGYERLVEAQVSRQREADEDPTAQCIASGLGYLDFARANPELFRLMFSSDKPRRSQDDFARSAGTAFANLVGDIRNKLGSDPYEDPVAMKQVVASWSIVHGLADLLISGRLDAPLAVVGTEAERDEIMSEIMLRVLEGPGRA